MWYEGRTKGHFSKYGCPVVPHHSFKRLCFFHWIAFVILLKINWMYIHGSISWLYSVPLICISGSQHVARVPEILSGIPEVKTIFIIISRLSLYFHSLVSFQWSFSEVTLCDIATNWMKKQKWQSSSLLINQTSKRFSKMKNNTTLLIVEGLRNLQLGFIRNINMLFSNEIILIIFKWVFQINISKAYF